ncbi:hypothetical protein ACJW30_02G159700 [Castanea mollissima]
MKRQAPKQRGFFRWYLQSTCSVDIVLLRQGLHWQSQTIIARTFLQKPGLPLLTLAMTMSLLNPFHQYDAEVLRLRTSCMSATLLSRQSSSLLPPVDRVTS